MTFGGRRPQSIEIPVKSSNEVVEVFLDDLPEDPSEIRAIIMEEGAPVDLFLHFAIEYYYQKKFDAFRYLLKAGLTECSRRGERKSEVPLLTTLAAFNIALGQDGDGDASYLEEATGLLNEAERINHLDMTLLLRKGLLLLVQRKIGQAEYQLKMVLSKEPENLAAHAALGCAAFLGGNWMASLVAFQTVLKKLPSSPEDVRIAIGQCMARLGKDTMAEAVFTRILSSNPKCIEALVALALLYINRKDKEDGLSQGMRLLKQAYDLDKNHPVVLLHLGNHFFFKQDWIKATSLIQNALNVKSIDDLVKSQLHFVMGKTCHAQEKFDEAFTNYTEAVRFNPNLTLAQLGLGQIYLKRGDVNLALSCFERVVELEKVSGREIKDCEFWTMMGMTAQGCVGANGSEGKAESYLKRANGSKSVDLCLALANIYETRPSGAGEAASYYRTALELDTFNIIKDSPSILNNFSVMLHSDGKLEEALNVIKRILKDLIDPRVNPEMFVMIKYNEARILEDEGKLTEAEAIYKELSLKNPNDISLHLRLGIICMKRHNFNEASEHYKEAIGIDESNIDAWLLHASNQLRVKAVTPARKSFERVLKQHDRHDLFALLALGNIYIEIGKHEKNPLRVNDNMKRALEFFIKALQIQPLNYYAANGVGVVLAEMGRYKEAKDVFLQVRQADPLFLEASLNLAHCFVEVGQFTAAIKSYEHVLERTAQGHKAANILLFMSRTMYVQARQEKDFNSFEGAITYLERAMHLLPINEVSPIKFNIALCQQEMAAAILKSSKEAVSVSDEQIAKGIQFLDLANEVFTSLTKNSDAGIDVNIAQQRSKYCLSLKNSLQSKMESYKNASASRSGKLEAVRVERERQAREAEVKRVKVEEERKREEAKNEGIARDLKAKFKLVEEVVAMGDAELDKSSDKSDEDGDGDGNSSSEEERDVKRKRRRRNVNEKEEIKHDIHQEEEEGASNTRSRRSKLSKDMISDDDE